MEPTSIGETPATFYVRKTVWLVFCAALILALAVPITTTLHRGLATLTARVSVWPTEPEVGGTAQLVISLADANDQEAEGGPVTQITASWDMPTMHMGTLQSKIEGALDDKITLVIPLQLDMAGRWSVVATLQTPGRSTWYGRLEITVLPAGPVRGTVET